MNVQIPSLLIVAGIAVYIAIRIHFQRLTRDQKTSIAGCSVSAQRAVPMMLGAVKMPTPM